MKVKIDIPKSAVTQHKRNEALDMAISALSDSAEDKTMEWIPAKVGKLFPSNDYKCSKCGNILNFDGVNCGRGDANFCPNCGADMREPEEIIGIGNADKMGKLIDNLIKAMDGEPKGEKGTE